MVEFNCPDFVEKGGRVEVGDEDGVLIKHQIDGECEVYTLLNPLEE